jgi:hypothetical protein
MEKTGNNATNGRGAYKDHQGDGQKGYGENDANGWGPFKPQQVSNKAYKDRQSSGQKGFGTFKKLWW